MNEGHDEHRMLLDVESLGRRLAEGGQPLTLPADHPAAESFAAARDRAAWLLDTWAVRVIQNAPSEQCEARLGADDLAELIKESLELTPPTVGLVLPSLDTSRIMQLGIQVHSGGDPAGQVVLVRPAEMWSRPFWIGKIFVGLIAGLTGALPLAIAVVVLDAFDNLVKLPKMTLQERRTLAALIAARARFGRPVSTHEVAVVAAGLMPDVDPHPDVDPPAMDNTISTTAEVLRVLADKRDLIVAVEAMTKCTVTDLEVLHIRHLMRGLGTNICSPQTGVWDTKETWFKVNAKASRKTSSKKK